MILSVTVSLIGCDRRGAPPSKPNLSAHEWFARGNKLRDGQKEEAVKAFTEAIRLDPNMDSAYFNRGLTYAELDRHAEAVADRDLLIQHKSPLGKKLQGLFAGVALANVSMGSHAADSGDLEGALKKYEAALIYNPTMADAHVGRGAVYLGQKKVHDAVREFDQALELDPKSSKAYHNRGQANLVRLDFKSALADFTKAIELRPDEASSFHERAKAYDGLGDKAKAQKDREHASRLTEKKSK
jgi:tetratricopeptide (TPR) repeat protein